MCNMCIIYIICYLNFLNICLTVRHISFLVSFLSSTLLLQLTFNYYYQFCSLIFSIFGLSRTWWYRTTPTIFTLRSRVLLKFTFGDMASFFLCSFFPNSNHERIWIVSPLFLSDITASGYFFYILSSSMFFMSRCFCNQFGIFPLYELELVQLQKYKILLGR